jgi:hypothetical protein
MNRASLWLACSMLLLTLVGTPIGQAGQRVTLCHFPPGNPAAFHTIVVSPHAAAAHIRRHGDVPGECCAIDDVCDDGNACTADACIDNACTSEPVDCDDGNPCTVEVGCDPVAGCSREPVACDAGEACQRDTGACLPVGQCPCWLGSNPIDFVTSGAMAANIFPCVEFGTPTCDGSVIRLTGQGSGPNGAMASVLATLSKPGADFCQNRPDTRGGGACSCPPPPEVCEVRGFIGNVAGIPVGEPNSCIAEFEAACAALQ